jgi:hypothetical protein
MATSEEVGLPAGFALDEAPQQPDLPEGFSVDPVPQEAPAEEEYEGVAQEFFEGVGSGATKIVQGFTELGALASDATFGTDYHEDVVKSFEEFRENLGLDPQGISGAIGEVGTQFVAPAGLAAKAVQGINFVAKSGKVGKFIAGLGAAGVTDAVVATNDTVTIGDFFEGGPTKTADLVGLESEERALEGLANKLKIGVEGAAGVVVAPFIVRGAGKVAGAAATAVGQVPGATQVARGIKAGAEKVGRKFAEIENARRMGETQSPFKNGVADALATLRYRGILPQEVAESRSLIAGLTEAEVRAADQLTTKLDGEIDEVVKRVNKATKNATPLTKSEIFNTIDQYLTTPKGATKTELMKALPKEILPTVNQMRTHIDELSDNILNSDFIKKNDFYVKETKKTLSETIRGNLGSYMARRYRALEDPSFKPTEEMLATAAARFKEDAVAVREELQKLAESGKRTTDELGLTDEYKLVGQVTDEQARIARDNFLERTKRTANVKPMKGVGRVAEQRLNTNLFLTRTNLKDYQRALLGEVKNPLENYVATVSNMAEFNAVDDYFRKIRNLAEANPDGIGKLFRKPPEGGFSDTARSTLDEEGFVVLGSGKGSSRMDKSVEESLDTSGWGSLHGYAVPERVYQDLTRTVVGDTGWLGNSLRSMYSGFLRIKGGTQYGKTILSPVTQIRNVTTASAFAAAQGNIGKGANLWESMRLVFENLRKLPDEQLAKEYADLQRLGIVNSQAELRELQELVRKGFGYTDDFDGQATKRFGANMSDNMVMRFIKGGAKKAESLYQGGDDLWKVYNFTFERNKLRNALDKMSDQAKADYLARKGVSIGEPPVKDGYVRLYHAGDLDPNATLKNTFTSNKQYAQSIGGKNKLYYVDVDKADDLVSTGAINDFKTTTTVTLGKDDFTKIGVPKTVQAEDFVEEFIKREAADIVRNNIPNYNLAPEAIKALRRAPVGNFIAFPYEIIRTGINTISRGIDELADPNVEIQKIGLRRLMGASSTFATVPAGLSAVGYAVSGVTKEEMDAYQRTMAPDWEKNARLIPIGRHEDGTPKYINFSYSNPYAMLEGTVHAAINAVERGELNDKSSAQIVSDAAFASLGELMSPFTQEAIALAAVRDVLDPEAENPLMQALGQFGRGGKTITGAKIYNPEDNNGDKLAKSFNHIVDTLLPSIVPLDESGGYIEPSRFARGFVNGLGLNETLGIDEKDRMGRERDLSQELARAFSGITESDSQGSKSLKYKGYEFAKARQDAANIFNSLARRPNVTPEQLIEAYRDANEARFRAFNRFYNTLKDAEQFGMKSGEVLRVLKEAKISGAGAISVGVFEPFKISKDVLKDMARNQTIDRVPFDQINEIMLQSMKQAYARDRIAAPEDIPVRSPVAMPSVPSGFTVDPAVPSGFVVDAPMPSGFVLDSGTTVVPTAPTPAPSTPQQVQEKRSTILGTASNPIDALRDLEIFQSGQD